MSTNQTVPLQGWTASPNGRGTIDILSSSVITLFLCSWSVLCLNVFPPSFSDPKKAWRKFIMAGICLLGPEFIFQLAVGQWSAARRSIADFKRSKYKGWTMTHAFFANMGGFAVDIQWSPNGERTTFPLDAKQVLYLVEHGYIKYGEVCIDKELIKDKDKVDGVVRGLIVCQILWYSVTVIARFSQHLDVTVLELATIGFILCSSGTYYFWFHKPMDVGRAIILHPTATLEEIRFEGGDCSGEHYRRTPMDFVERVEWSWTRYWAHWKGLVRKLTGINFDRTVRPMDKIPDDNFPLITGRPLWVLCFFQVSYGAVHLTGWSLPFPTCTERLLWHIATVTIMVCILVTWAVEVWGWRITSTLESSLEKEDIEDSANRPRWHPKARLRRFFAKMRNTTEPLDPVMDVPLRALIPVTSAAAIYSFARAYVIVGGFVNLRALPPSAYESINWTAFLPHF
jgi:hypothetical protein